MTTNKVYKTVVIETREDVDRLDELDGKTYQVAVLPDGKLKLYEVNLCCEARRCPIIVGNERCGQLEGHPGKHGWAGGD